MDNTEEKVSIPKKELLKIKERLEEILKPEKKESREEAFKKAFGILKGSFEGKDSLEYVKGLRREWRMTKEDI